MTRSSDPLPRDPAAVELLEMLTSTDPVQHEFGRAVAALVLQEWRKAEDIDALRRMLGLQGSGRGNRRTKRQAVGELRLLQAYMQAVIVGRPDPQSAAARWLFPRSSADELESHRKRVEAAVKKWQASDWWPTIEGLARESVARSIERGK